VTLGLLNTDFDWIVLKNYTDKKSSSILQPEVWKLLSDHNLEPHSLTRIVSLAGPGFYTGLRLTEGFCDVFKFFGVNHFSFYAHEVPLLWSIDEGIFLTKSYRGEYFVHTWAKGLCKNEMVATSDLPSKLSSFSKVFIHSLESLDDFSRALLPEYVCVTDLLNTHSSIIIKKVVESSTVRESFYFRPPEDEFKANP
jgi:tRNA threonylcarbamoyladenosine biosynthesis protein TsaB